MAQRDYVEKDYYRILGVSKDATQSDIAKAYRRLARENHPDAKPGDAAAESRFKEVSEAYSVLSNAEKRKEYDDVRRLVGSGAFGGGGPGGFSGGFPGGGVAGGFDLGDIFGQVFRNGGNGAGGGFGGPRQTRRAARPRGRDLETTMTLSFADAMAGVTTTLRVSGQATCRTCRGSGAAPGTSPVTCQVCGGSGVIASNQGLFSFSEPCDACGGTGRQIPTPCPTCHGTGTEDRPREIRARIPAGVKDGARIRLAGRGEGAPAGGEPGDLFVNVKVEPHPLFGRRGDDLTLTVPITYGEAVLGTRLTVPTLDGPVTLRVPPGTPSGKTLRVRGRGAPAGRGRGDLLVTVELVVPRNLTKTQRKALESYAALEDGDALRERFVPYLGAVEPVGGDQGV